MKTNELEVLISCMHQNDFSIIEKSNLMKVPAVIINQCNIEQEMTVFDNSFHKMIYTNERGLSKSRNLAVANSKGTISLISDDDEVFLEGFSDKIRKAYKDIPDADVIIFKLKNLNKKLGNQIRRLHMLDILRVSSLQISFKTNSIRNKIFFDVKMGAGTGNGGGEENKFLLECLKCGLKIYFVPYEIAELTVRSPSSWFFGWDEKYFYNLGQSLRYTFGKFFSRIYISYTLITKINRYKDTISFKNARKAILKGWKENRLGK